MVISLGIAQRLDLIGAPKAKSRSALRSSFVTNIPARIHLLD